MAGVRYSRTLVMSQENSLRLAVNRGLHTLVAGSLRFIFWKMEKLTVREMKSLWDKNTLQIYIYKIITHSCLHHCSEQWWNTPTQCVSAQSLILSTRCACDRVTTQEHN